MGKSVDKFNVNDMVLHEGNGRVFYVADRATTDSGQLAYRLSTAPLPNMCGTMNWWVVARELTLVQRARNRA